MLARAGQPEKVVLLVFGRSHANGVVRPSAIQRRAVRHAGQPHTTAAIYENHAHGEGTSLVFLDGRANIVLDSAISDVLSRSKSAEGGRVESRAAGTPDEKKSGDSARNSGWKRNRTLEKSRFFPRDSLCISSICNLEMKGNFGIVEIENRVCNGRGGDIRNVDFGMWNVE